MAPRNVFDMSGIVQQRALDLNAAESRAIPTTIASARQDTLLLFLFVRKDVLHIAMPAPTVYIRLQRIIPVGAPGAVSPAHASAV
eukprot:SAG31_NODE_8887_length_1367_cov_2.069401_2_plen_85_part_00